MSAAVARAARRQTRMLTVAVHRASPKTPRISAGESRRIPITITAQPSQRGSDARRAIPIERIPLGRYGTTEEVAELISLLASDRGGYMTGQNIRIDGGITRSV